TYPEDSAAVLDALINSYQGFLEETYKIVSEDTVTLIRQARNTLKKDLTEAEEKYRTFHRDSPLVFKNKDGINISQDRVAGIEAKRSALLIRKTELEERLKAIDQAVKDGRGRTMVLALLNPGPAAAKSPPSEKSPEEQLLPLLLQEQQLLESYGADHPDVKSVRKRIALVRNVLKQQAAAGDPESEAAAADP